MAGMRSSKLLTTSSSTRSTRRNRHRGGNTVYILLLRVLIMLIACWAEVVGGGQGDTALQGIPPMSLLRMGDLGESPSHVYARLADINLGAIFSIHLSRNETCSTELRESGVVQYTEAVAYAIDSINNSPDLLPGTQLGFVIMDDCMRPLNALAQTLHFFPMADRPTTGCRVGRGIGQSPHNFYDVVGVIGAESSPVSIVMANVLNIFQIPQVSPTSTSDLLSDKNNYPYFMRMMPPDRLQVQAILDIMLHFNWTYMAMVHSQGGYGAEAVTKLKMLATQKGICIGAMLTIPKYATERHLDKIITDLRDHNVRIVVLFVDQEDARGVFMATKRKNMIGHFVWIGSDGLGVNMDDFDGIEDAMIGTISLRPYHGHDPKFEQYFESLSPNKTGNQNPWLPEMWESLFECKWGQTCTGKEHIKDSRDYAPETIVGYVIDSVYTFAHALHALIEDHCQHLAPRRLATCIKGPLLLKYLKDVTFAGITGNISFDDKGDVLGRYEILHFHNDSTALSGASVTRVGIWNQRNRKLTINNNLVVWARSGGSHSSLGNDDGEGGNQSIQDSFGCGRKCSMGEIYSYIKNTCCWICRPCAPNEIPVDDATKCSKCKFLYWPSPDSTDCVKIPPTYMRFHEPPALVMVALAVGGLLVSSLILAIFIQNNDARIIKATSRELSYMMLSGVFVQYLLVFTFISKPNQMLCVFNFIGFNVSFAIVYAALLTRTNRIFRIFYAGKRTKVMPSLTSPVSQVLIAFVLIGIQVMITVLAIVLQPPGVQERMPVVLEPEVELVCLLPVQGFVTSLSYNLLLVLICTMYAFKTRKLPDNFNESRCITLCVYTTLVIWLAFLPTFFTTSRAYYQVILISSALLLNATVTLLCLYFPRVCALRAERPGGTGGCTNNANTFKYTSNGGAQGMLMTGRLETGPSGAAGVDDQATELSDCHYGASFG